MKDDKKSGLRIVDLRIVPGVAAAIGTMLLAIPLANKLGEGLLAWRGIEPGSTASPVSAVSVAIVLGIIVRNTVGLPELFRPGIHFSMTTLLRLGIIFVGIKLSLAEMARLGLWGVPIVATTVAAGLLLILWLNNRMGLPPKLGALIAAGTGICGVTAIVSVAPAIDADEQEVAYAVASITLFGLLGMLLYPYVAATLFVTSEQAGMWLGVAIHDTSQVVGAALTFREMFADEVAFQTATVTKLTRNLFLVVVVPLLSLYDTRRSQSRTIGAGAGPTGATKMNWRRLVPGFIVGFVLMAIVRTVGDSLFAGGVPRTDLPLSNVAAGWLSPERWESFVRIVGDEWGALYLLGTAMAAVGLDTRFSVFKGVGARPFVVGFVGAVLVGLIGFVAVFSLGRFVRL